MFQVAGAGSCFQGYRERPLQGRAEWSEPGEPVPWRRSCSPHSLCEGLKAGPCLSGGPETDSTLTTPPAPPWGILGGALPCPRPKPSLGILGGASSDHALSPHTLGLYTVVTLQGVTEHSRGLSLWVFLTVTFRAHGLCKVPSTTSTSQSPPAHIWHQWLVFVTLCHRLSTFLLCTRGS